LELLNLIFDAKQVPLSLLLRIGDTREFHRPDCLSVETSVAGGSIEGFDFYFDFVLRQIERLKAFGVV
jgi:hypothetical protein